MKDKIETQLALLIGLPLALTRRAADMRIFHFGQVRLEKTAYVGGYDLHIQCAWRLDGPLGIITGRSDLFHMPTGGYFSEDWDYSGDTIQDIRLRSLPGIEYPVSGAFADMEKRLFVERVKGTATGDAEIFFSHGYRLMVFPTGTKGEAWRMFRPGIDEEHFVIDEELLGFQ